jgi:hypothetical protein
MLNPLRHSWGLAGRQIRSGCSARGRADTSEAERGGARPAASLLVQSAPEPRSRTSDHDEPAPAGMCAAGRCVVHRAAMGERRIHQVVG